MRDAGAAMLRETDTQLYCIKYAPVSCRQFVPGQMPQKDIR